MTHTSRLTRNNNRKRSDKPAASGTNAVDYRVGPGRPPKEYQFQPGQSGNPAGAKRKRPSIATDLKRLLEQALNKKVTLRQGDRERIISKAAAGIEQLVNQFAQGDRHARRDLIDLANTLGVDLVPRQTIADAIDAAISADDEALLADYARRHRDDDDRLAQSKDPEEPNPTNPNEKEK